MDKIMVVLLAIILVIQVVILLKGKNKNEQQKIVDAIQLEIDKQNEIKNQIATLRRKIDSIIENAILSND